MNLKMKLNRDAGYFCLQRPDLYEKREWLKEKKHQTAVNYMYQIDKTHDRSEEVIRQLWATLLFFHDIVNSLNAHNN